MRNDVLNTIPNWVEDFEGKTTVDETIFTADGKPKGTYNGESYVLEDWGVIREDQACIRDNQLVLSMTKRDNPKVFKSDPVQKERWHNTAWLRTRGKVELVQGAVEMVAKFPCPPGFWAGGWARATVSQGEVDFFESPGRLGKNPNPAAHDLNNRYTATVHYKQDGTDKVGVESPITPANLGGDFHTYGFIKTAEEIIIYFEREEIHRVKRSDNPTKFDAAFPPGEPLYLLATTQAGSRWFGLPNDGTPDHCELVIERVTVWDFDNPVSGQGEYSSTPVSGSSSS